MPHGDPTLDTLIIDRVGAMVVVTDNQGLIIRFNQGGTRLMGYTEEEVLHRPIWEVFPIPEYRARTHERFKKLSAGAELQIETTWLAKTGQVVHLSCYCMGIAGPDGQTKYTIGTGVDVTERVKVEHALRVREERFRTTFDNASIGMVLVDPAGRYLHVNRAFCELTGYSEPQVLGRDMLELTHPDDREHNKTMFLELVAGKRQEYVIEKRYVRRDLSLVWVKVSASIGTGNSSHPATVIGLFENISEAKAAHEAINSANEQLRRMNETLEHRVAQRTAELDRSKQELVEQSRILRSILDSMGDGVLVVDGRGQIALINPALERLTGVAVSGNSSMAERVSRPWFFHADGKTPFAPRDMPIYRSSMGEAVDDTEVLVRRDGKPDVWTSATARPLHDESGKPSGAVVVVRDVTERKRHQAELEEANVSLRESEGHYRELADSHLRLAREVEHRVRNNLQGLFGLVSAMRDRAKDVKSFADAMESRLSAMQHVHELLARTRWKGVGLRSLVEGALATLARMACDPAEMHISGPEVFIGSRQLLPLTMVIVEWFTNSCKYGVHSAPGGRLDIRWELINEEKPQQLRLRWTEQNGPAVASNIVPSLGTELVQAFVRRELGGSVQLRYPPGGVDHLLEMTVREDDMATPESKGM